MSMSRTPGGWVETDFDTPTNEEESPESPISEIFDVNDAQESSSSSRSSSPEESSQTSNTTKLNTTMQIGSNARIVGELGSPSSLFSFDNSPETLERAAGKAVVVDLFPMDTTDVEDTNWKAFPIPAELLDFPTGTSMEIETIIEASIERLQDRLVEEDFQREQLEREAREQEEKSKGKGKEVVRENTENVNGERSTTYASSNPPNRPAPKTPVPPMGNIYSPSSYLSSLEGNWSFGSNALGDAKARGGATNSVIGFNGDNNGRKSKGKSLGFAGFFWRSKMKPMHTSTMTEMPGSETVESVHSGSSTSETKECVSCLDDFESGDTIHLECHDYCKPCFETLIDTAVTTETYWPPKCCLNEIPSTTITKHISPALSRRFNAISVERAVPAASRIYCSKPTCAAFIPPASINTVTSTATCPTLTCRTKTCTHCHGASHPNNAACPQDTALLATLSLAEEQGWRRCHSCHALVEHNQGCIHMTCKCKAQFCYICGLKWRTCACSDAQLATIRTRAEAGRRTRQLAEAEMFQRTRIQREAEEARERSERARAEQLRRQEEELAEMLREIEEFEAGERAREEAEAEALRVIAQREREEREQRRIQEINRRFYDLRNELDLLHVSQRISMIDRYDAAISALRTQQASRTEMESRHDAELLMVGMVKQSKLSDFEYQRDEEFQERLTAERKLEDQYVKQLTDYWTKQAVSDPITHINIARDAYRAQNEKAHREWDLAMRREYGTLSRELELEVLEVRKKHESERRRAGPLLGDTEARMLQFKRVRFSDGKWLEAVAEVREEMLSRFEQEEYAREV